MVVDFTPSITMAYEYFRNVGIDNNEPDYLLTDRLILYPKPWKVIRVCASIFAYFGIKPNPYANTELPRVIRHIRTYVQRHPELDQETVQKADFVVKTLESLHTKKDPHLETLGLKNRWRTTNRAAFESSIHKLENYFSAIGIDGKAADRYITKDLELVPKHSFITRCAYQALNWLGISCFAPPDVEEVKEVLRTFVREEDLPQELKARAEKVAKMLEIITSKKDKGNAKLGMINRFELACQRAHYTVEKEPYFAYLSNLRQAYLRGDIESIKTDDLLQKIDELGKLDREARIKDRRDQQFWGNLPDDVWRLILKNLPAETASKMREVSRRWLRLINERATWQEIAQKQKSLPLFSAASPGVSPEVWFRQNRAQVVALPKASFTTTKTPLQSIFPHGGNQWTLHRNEHLLVVSDPLHYHVKQDERFVEIPRTLGQVDLPVSIDGKFYTVEIGADRVLVLKEWNLATRQCVQQQVGQNSATIRNCSISNKKVYFVLNNSRYGVLDLETKQYQEIPDPEPLDPNLLIRTYIFGGNVYVKINDNQLRVGLLQGAACVNKVLNLPGIQQVLNATNKVCYVLANSRMISAVDLETGDILARYYLRGQPLGAAIHKGMLFVGYEGFIQAFDLLTTKTLHTFKLENANRGWVLNDGKFYTIDTQITDLHVQIRPLVLNAIDINTPSTACTKLLNGLDSFVTLSKNYYWTLDILNIFLRILARG